MKNAVGNAHHYINRVHRSRRKRDLRLWIKIQSIRNSSTAVSVNLTAKYMDMISVLYGRVLGFGKLCKRLDKTRGCWFTISFPTLDKYKKYKYEQTTRRKKKREKTEICSAAWFSQEWTVSVSQTGGRMEKRVHHVTTSHHFGGGVGVGVGLSLRMAAFLPIRAGWTLSETKRSKEEKKQLWERVKHKPETKEDRKMHIYMIYTFSAMLLVPDALAVELHTEKEPIISFQRWFAGADADCQ